MKNKNYFLKLILADASSEVRNFLTKRRVKYIVFPIETKITTRRVQSKMDAIIRGGNVDVIGKLKPIGNKIKWIPPKKHTVYSLSQSTNIDEKYFLIRNHKGKEIIIEISRHGKVIQGLTDFMVCIFRRKILEGY